MEWFHRFLSRYKFYQYLLDWTKVVILPGFRPLPLYTVASFFFKEIKQDSLVNRASSLAYSFLLATFPVIIFLFTLIPYIPIDNFQKTLLDIIETVLPHNAYMALRETIDDIVNNGNLSLLSIGFLTAMIFATNGIAKLMKAFNKSSLVEETRTWLKRRWIALVLTCMIALSLFAAIVILIISQALIYFIQDQLESTKVVLKYVVVLANWAIVIGLYFVTIAILYRYGPANKRKWKFVSPGSILATCLAVLTSVGFSFYINNFSSYNKVYGSIGTLIVVMIWLYLNSLIILIGFELNASIDLSKRTIKIVKPRYNTFRTTKKSGDAH
ncbi:YihY/virulence factor BrkB family protein [Mucilaginibacter myungsuensis]|uniref:YihY/virulence factor BrkB family protein n=1 Tax=Mucilaginibacter myungsuensis TaxID=649104 RepID=A0A929PX93_9SPHI|nr:YihY/virulence factor BrkB family protein [Mucilaginibacter myungsuensis]MBE9663618.1 YihY/virulence factor BrkB family protein [Mucilaginibacter myungsuensis]MDN3599058.1 YihY/virulence factor BrkB family protein [Mucilaginibacter myungsuensis]